jgi:hypothetical protein
MDDPRAVSITDVRDAGREYRLNATGSFHPLLRTFATSAIEQVKARLYPEMQEITETLLGRKVAAVFDHATRRRPDPNARLRGGGVARQPLHRVHCDFTPVSARHQIMRTLGDAGKAWLERPFALVNYWRPITGPLRDDPGDLRAISRAGQSCGSARLSYGERDTASPQSRPPLVLHVDMQPDDAIFFKVYDEADSARLSHRTAPSRYRRPAPRCRRAKLRAAPDGFYD